MYVVFTWTPTSHARPQPAPAAEAGSGGSPAAPWVTAVPYYMLTA